uniref:VPS10 domain-containing protein n=1 Tax=Latimeria chalumnae TaxID=7897 RepID=M3XHJ4_LATCH|nr:PREDICTED: sortilin-like [Latimeria chalumnae]|eukprot:XP_005998684.1 PREDICTED: sortilin-like [Latimeria chalumnae]
MAPIVFLLTFYLLVPFFFGQNQSFGFPSGSDERSSVFSRGEPLKKQSFRAKRDVGSQSAGTEASLCISEVSAEELKKLKQHTHPFDFEDDDGSTITLAWVGDGNGVILALTTFEMPFHWLFKAGSSRLYRSEDYGKTFSDISDRINKNFIRREFGINVGPENSQRVILTADVSWLSDKGKIYTSSDAGKNFQSTDLPFQPAVRMSFQPTHPDHLLAHSLGDALWLSLDFGKTWTKVHESVHSFIWGSENTFFFTAHLNNSDTGMLVLKRTMDLGKTTEVIAKDVYAFGFSGRFLFASIIKTQGAPRRVFVSLDQGNSWSEAQLPPVTHEQFYSILAADDDMIFMHVDEQGDAGFGTIYISDDRGVLYSESLNHHLFGASNGANDFTNVTSLRGVYITNVIRKDGSVQSVITFDRGGKWKPLKTPENSHCASSGKPGEMCNLHIHGDYSISQHINVPMPPLTASSAIGLIITHGSVGNAISSLTPDVYISDDGGYTWMKTLSGPHHYAILDSGGLIVAVEYYTDQAIQTLKFSTDEGQCWKLYNFTENPIIFAGLASEPGTKSMNISIWGYRPKQGYSAVWISVTIDFEELLTRVCDENDYITWLAHSTGAENEMDGCILGYKEKFRRLKKSSVCRNGRDYIVSKDQKPCLCTKDDYFCDFGYYRKENSSDCIEEADLKGHDLEYCLNGNEELLKTKGYRKAPGNKCEGGFEAERIEEVKARCEKLRASTDSKPNRTAVIAISILIVAAALMTGVALILKKYVCGGRALVYRYSALQPKDDDPCLADELDSQADNTRQVYHDDSDEDLIE